MFLIFVQGFFVLNNAGKSLGLDALIARAPFGRLPETVSWPASIAGSLEEHVAARPKVLERRAENRP